MTLYNMLERLENTLNEITVKGRDNHSLLLGALQAIDQMKVMVEEMPKDGEDNGRQTDKLAD